MRTKEIEEMIFTETVNTSDFIDVLDINSVLAMLHQHFSTKLSSRLPVIAVYSIYEQLFKQVKRYENKILRPLNVHSAADKHSYGDIEIWNADNTPFEIVEIKHNISIDRNLVFDVAKKSKNTAISRYYILTTAKDNFTSRDEEEYLNEFILKIKRETDLEIIANGILASLKYYLQFIDDYKEFIKTYTKNLIADSKNATEIKKVHIVEWQRILKTVSHRDKAVDAQNNTAQSIIRKAISTLYAQEIELSQIQLQKTKKEFKGHLTLVVFPLLKISKKSPEQTALEIGNCLLENKSFISEFNIIKGFLNLTIAPDWWTGLLNEINAAPEYGTEKPGKEAPLVMIEYSSPNTNKPLHLGHIRNNLLGCALSEIIKANGCRVVKTNIVNDRGIHICKSMLAWEKWGNGETPESSAKKGDHLIGDYYVKFDREYKKELSELQSAGMSQKEAEEKSPLMAEAREMLRKWEAGNPETLALWEMMNNWVYAGFDETYKALGVDFDKIYYESQTYTEGKKEVERGLQKGIFYRKEDGSVWADLTADGLDEKLLLRADGTSVYMTQDIGTAKLRFDDYPIDKMIYVVGNEQNYHFRVLSILLDKSGFEFGKGLVHFSYGMVELPEGKMKSREGTVVDADDLIEEMIKTAKETAKELGKWDGYPEEEINKVAKTVGLGALKYFILKVDPRKNMVFNPKESIDFNGNTGPFIQYTYARIRSVLRKYAESAPAETQNIVPLQLSAHFPISFKEESLIQLLSEFPATVKEAADNLSPAIIANYIYELVKEYNQFYHDFPILREENEDLKKFRLVLSQNVGKIIKTGFGLLGIDVPERM